MDDYTWQKHLQKRRRSKGRLVFVVLLLLAAAIGTAIWYFAFFLRTPEYALTSAQEAWARQDTETFKHFVNLNLLTSRAYDDLTVDLFAYDATLTPQTRVMFEKFYILIKPQLTQGTEAAILSRMTAGEWLLPEGTDILKGRQLGIDYERFLERSQLRNTTLLAVEKVERNGPTATAALRIREDYTQTEFLLELSMEQAEDGHWQVAYIKNYRQYLDTIAPLQNQHISQYIEATKGIVTTFNEIFRDQQIQFQYLTGTAKGKLSDYQRGELQTLIRDYVIPSLTERQKELDAVPVPPGAQYLAVQRKLSTETALSAWEHFLKGLKEDDPSEFDTAEALHKQALAIDLRVDDIIHHTAISKNIPNMP